MSPIVYIFIGIGVLLAAFVAVIAVRTAAFTPRAGVTPSDEVCEPDVDRVISNLRALVRCRTVSRYSHEDEDEEEFAKFTALLPTLYPAVYDVCTLTEMEDRALLYRWRGREEGEPTVLMAHYDVVPVSESDWEKPPFEAILEDGVLWGRGTLDTKVTFGSILYAVNEMIERGFTPRRDVYLAFSGGEEVNGRGAARIVDYFQENGITPALVLDEGGAVVEGVFPGVKEPCALVGIAEKGFLDLEYKVRSRGGHASAPKPHSPVPTLAAACSRLEGKPFRYHLTRPVAEMFDTLGRHSTLLYRIIFANLWCFSPVLDLICRRGGGDMNALMRTTVAFTQLSGSSASNVIPPEATMVSNIRLNPEDTMESAVEYIKRTVNDESVILTPLRGNDPSPISDTSCEGYKTVAKAIASTWRGSIVSPYLMVQCSDSRHWGRISDRVFRFSAMDLTSEERATIHGHNERIRVDCAGRAAEFYLRLVAML